LLMTSSTVCDYAAVAKNAVALIIRVFISFIF